jgi:hypothetical protein
LVVPLYFAYADDLDPERFAILAKGAKRLGPARLARHCLVALKGGAGSLERDPRREVWGVLWDVPLAAMPLIDRHQAKRGGAVTKLIQPVILDGGAKQAVMHSVTAGLVSASPQEREALARLARAEGLPAAYVEELATGAPPKRKPGTPLFAAPVSSLKTR